MNPSQYSLSSTEYKSSVFPGFSQLQKDEEFVDLTLAADGCISNVHKNIVALASPYLRQILRNMQGNSPVIYLNKVREEILQYLIEYIYHGEVNVPLAAVDEFVEISKSLHIVGFDDIDKTKATPPRASTAKKRKLGNKISISNIKDREQNYSMENENQSRTNDFVFENLNNQYMESNTELPNTELMDDIGMNINKRFLVQDLIMNTEKETNHASAEKEKTKNASEDVGSLIEIPTDNIILQNLLSKSIDIGSIIDTPTGDALQHLPAHMSADVGNIEIQTDLSQNIPGQSAEIRNVIAIPSENTLLTNTGATNKNYKIVVKHDTKQTETINNIPIIEIQLQSIPTREDEMTPIDPINLLPKQSTLTYHIDQPIQAVLDTDQNNTQKNKPVIKILHSEVIKSAEESAGELKANLDDMRHMAQYSLSERGSLQLILNRFIYCGHGTSTKKQRWRCIDYRRGSCQAVVDTVHDAIVARRVCKYGMLIHGKTAAALLPIFRRNPLADSYCTHGQDRVNILRKGVHTHTYHDAKIYKKHEAGLIFSSRALALGFQNAKEELKMVSGEEMDNLFID